MSTENEYSLRDLADVAGVTPRTVRYYIGQGLLPAPGGAGPAARYGEGHLVRLRLVRQLQRQHLPLAEIRARLSGLDDESILELQEVPETPRMAESAIDYIRTLMAGTRQASPIPTPAPAPREAPAPTPALTAEPDRSQWERISLTPDIELHIRRPLGRLQNKRVDRLIVIARQLLEGDPS